MLKVGECDLWKRRDEKKKIGGQVHCIPFPLPKDEKKKKTKKNKSWLIERKEKNMKWMKVGLKERMHWRKEVKDWKDRVK